MLICFKIEENIFLAFHMLSNVKMVTLLGKECNVKNNTEISLTFIYALSQIPELEIFASLPLPRHLPSTLLTPS